VRFASIDARQPSSGMSSSARCGRVMRKTFWLGAALLAFPACGTEEIAAPITYVGTEPGPDRGELSITVAPTADTYEEDQAQARNNSQLYGVFIDGRQLVFE